MSLPKRVTLIEVGPRDGLQNISTTIPTPLKIQFIQQLIAAGCRHIETTSFVSPKAVPAMSDHLELTQALTTHPEQHYLSLIPNLHGLKRALAAGVSEISVLTAASNSFCQHNINCTIEQSLEHIKAICQQATPQVTHIRGYISCIFHCPYEGAVNPQQVVELSQALHDLGCDEISLGDTTGVGTPSQAQHLIQQVSQVVPLDALAVHFHNTYGQALANIFACLECGIQRIDSAAAGLGGCPYAPGASGNIATEDVVYMLQGIGIECGIDLDLLIQASRPILKFIQQETHSNVGQARLTDNDCKRANEQSH